jgi:hypothetical protein
MKPSVADSMTTYKVRIPLHGSPSEEQLTALTDSIGHDAVVSGGPDDPATWSLTITVESDDIKDVTRKARDILHVGVVIDHEFLGPDPDQPAVRDDRGNLMRPGFKFWPVISYSVHVKAHGSVSEEELEALTEALGGDAGAVASIGTADPTWSVTFTVVSSDPGSAVSNGIKLLKEAARPAKIVPLAMDIFHVEATGHDMLSPHPDQMRLTPVD